MTSPLDQMPATQMVSSQEHKTQRLKVKGHPFFYTENYLQQRLYETYKDMQKLGKADVCMHTYKGEGGSFTFSSTNVTAKIPPKKKMRLIPREN